MTDLKNERQTDIIHTVLIFIKLYIHIFLSNLYFNLSAAGILLC